MLASGWGLFKDLDCIIFWGEWVVWIWGCLIWYWFYHGGVFRLDMWTQSGWARPCFLDWLRIQCIMHKGLGCGSCCPWWQSKFIDVYQKQTSAIKIEAHGFLQKWADQDLSGNIYLCFQSSEQWIWQQQRCSSRYYGDLKTNLTYWDDYCMLTIQRAFISEPESDLALTSVRAFPDLRMQLL